MTTPVPPIPAHGLLLLLTALAVLLATARLFGALSVRLGMPAVTGELLAGVVLGPSLFGHLAPAASNWLFPAKPEQMHLIDAVGQFGVLMLVGLAGMQLELGALRERVGSAFKVSLAGLLVPLAMGIGVGLILPTPLRPAGTDPAVFAGFMGIALCVSAIPVIAKTLMELKLTHRNVGQLILTAGMIDDAIGWFLLSIVAAMATYGVRTDTVLTSLAYLVFVVAFAILVGRRLVRWILQRAERTGDPKHTIGATVVLLLASAAATHAMGLEAILGTFVVGILIGSSGVDLSRLAPLNTLVVAVLAPLFFATAGLRMDLSALAHPGLLLAALGILALAIIGKFLGAFVGGKLSGLQNHECVALGAGMNARGVIEVVIAMVGLRLGVLGIEAYTVLILVAIVTSVMAPPILRRAMLRAEVTEEESARAKRTFALTRDDGGDERAAS